MSTTSSQEQHCVEHELGQVKPCLQLRADIFYARRLYSDSADVVTGDGYPLSERMRSQERRSRYGTFESGKVNQFADIGVEFGR